MRFIPMDRTSYMVGAYGTREIKEKLNKHRKQNIFWHWNQFSEFKRFRWAKSKEKRKQKNLSTFFKWHFIAVLIVSPLNRISSIRTTIEQINDLNKWKYVNFCTFFRNCVHCTFSLFVSLVLTIWTWTWTSIGCVA